MNIPVNLIGLKKSIVWKKKLDKIVEFKVDNKTLNDVQIRQVVNYGIKKGYKTDKDIPIEEIKKILFISEEYRQTEKMQMKLNF